MINCNIFLTKYSAEQLKKFARIAEIEIGGSLYDNKFEARNKLAAIWNASDEDLTENRRFEGLKKGLYTTLLQIKSEKESVFTTFKFFLEYLAQNYPKKNVFSKRNFIDYLEQDSAEDEKGKIPLFKIKYVLERALQEHLVSINGKNYTINR